MAAWAIQEKDRMDLNFWLEIGEMMSWNLQYGRDSRGGPGRVSVTAALAGR